MNFGHALPVQLHTRPQTLDHRQRHGITASSPLTKLCRDIDRTTGKHRFFRAAHIQGTIRQLVPNVIRDTERPAQIIQQLIARAVMGKMGDRFIAVRGIRHTDSNSAVFLQPAGYLAQSGMLK